MIYLMNSAVMPSGNYGTYRYSPATLDDLRAVVRAERGEWTSCLGYPQNAELVERWVGIRPPINRVETRFAPGDSAIVMRLRYRADPQRSKGAPVSANAADWEFAWVHFVGPPT